MVLATGQARGAPQWEFAVSAERAEQAFASEYDAAEATIDTITFTPGLSAGNWQFSLTMPWQSIDGSYFVNNLYPNLARTCDALNELSSLEKLILVRNTGFTVQDLQYCSDTGGRVTASGQDSVSGWNDFELFANYYLPPVNEFVSGSLGLGYQFDNGDATEGLGNGAQLAMVETAWLFRSTHASLLTTLGYRFVVSEPSHYDMQDHGYAALDARWHIWRQLDLGIEYSYQQTDNDLFSDYDYFTYFVGVQFGGHWNARVFTVDYGDEAGFPEQEIGASLAYYF
ncbi:MAG: hypothetical protein CML06_13665 [Pseudomonadales bacterium]|nr:hypothetical protein [Pseudomonadales bacterium]